MGSNILPILAAATALASTCCAVASTPLKASRWLFATLLLASATCFSQTNWQLGGALVVWALVLLFFSLGAIALAPPAPTSLKPGRTNEALGMLIALGFFGVVFRGLILALRQIPNPVQPAVPHWSLSAACVGVLLVLVWMARRKYG